MNITMLLSWQQLTDSQLLFVFKLIGHDYSSVRVKTLCLFKWGAKQVLAVATECRYVPVLRSSTHCEARPCGREHDDRSYV